MPFDANSVIKRQDASVATLTDVAQTTINTSNIETQMMDPPDDIQATDADGFADQEEQQTITISDDDDGTFRLAFEGYTTAPIDHDATAAAIDSALEELNPVNLVTVTGNTGGPWTVTFVGTHSNTNVSRLDGDTSNLISGTVVDTIDYTYDEANQLTSISDDDDDSSYAYTYDDLGRVLTVDNDGTSGVPQVKLTSTYDANFNRKSLTAKIDTTDDFKNTYTYDNLNRLTTVKQDAQSGGNTVADKRVDFTYNAIGQFTKLERFKDVAGTTEVATSEYTYDSLGRITDLEHKKGGTNLFTAHEEWSYDQMSRVTQYVNRDETVDYTYDKTSQLTEVKEGVTTLESYSYDDNGNRTMTGYTTGSNNQLTNDGTYSYLYDDEGNRIKRTHDTTDAVTEYDWDHRNRLIRVTEKDDMGVTSQVVEYTYDVFNRRIEKAVDTSSPFTMTDAVIERYVYDDINGVASVDGGNVVLDFVDPDGTGSTAIALDKRYLYGNAVDQILAQEDVTVSESSADRVYWPLVDNLGTVRDLAKNDGTKGEHYKYDSLGQVTSGDTSVRYCRKSCSRKKRKGGVSCC